MNGDPIGRTELERQLQENPDDIGIRRRLAAALLAEAIDALSVTRDQNREITSALQQRICERNARQVLAMEIDDTELTAAATTMLDRARAAGTWIWVSQLLAIPLAAIAVAIGLGAAVIGGLRDNVTLAAIGALLGSALFCAVVVHYRRPAWRIQAENLRPLIVKPGL